MNKERNKAKNIFKIKHPCMYGGSILCEDCNKRKICDMKAGRELHMGYFISGWIYNEKQ